MAYCASKVVILATGGTIVSSGASATQMTGYSIQGLGVEDLLSAVPMLADVADVEAARVSNIDSSSMTSEVWLKLANAVEEALRREDVSGVVITHGTDTMEECLRRFPDWSGARRARARCPCWRSQAPWRPRRKDP